MSPDHPFFILLRSGLYETGCHLPPSVSTDEWFTWMKWAGDQAVLGLFYRGTEHLPLDYPLPEELSFSLLAAVDGIEKRNRHLQATLPEILDYFLHPGLHPRVMKGPEAARFYRYPLLRQSGDLDLFFSCDEFHAAIALADAGLERGGERPDRSRHYTLKGIELDIHDRYFDLHTDRKRLPSVPSPEATLLMLSAHILKHAMGPGIGLRQLCDMAMACEALEGSYAPSSLHRFARESGTWRWNRLLTAFLQQYLGMKASPFPPLRDAAPLMRIIWEGGNFGQHGPHSRSDKTAFRQKEATLHSYFSHLPFSLRYAPREFFPGIFDLVKGNLRALFR